MIVNCPSITELVGFLDAKVGPSEALLIAEHLDDCEHCDQLVANLEKQQLGRFERIAGHELLLEPQRSISKMKRGNSVHNMNSRVGMARNSERLAQLQPGQKFVDCRLIVELGAGAFGRVFLAEQTSLRRLVALKVATRRSQEPELLASLHHPHIVRVFHYDDRLSDVGLHLLYMQYVPGCTLRRLISRLQDFPQSQWCGALLLKIVAEECLDPNHVTCSMAVSEISTLDWPTTVCWLGARLAHAMQYSHKNRVHHRDIKPENILVAPDGKPFLVDFNVSFGSSVDDSSPEDSFGGSLPYMSPEQLEAFISGQGIESVGDASDVYSMGMVLWELLTGRRPFPNETWQGATTRCVAKNLARATSVSPYGNLPDNSPRDLEQVLRDCLSDDTER